MTFKQFVLELCKREGKKRQVNVAQMSEVASYALMLLGRMSACDAAKLIAKYGKR